MSLRAIVNKIVCEYEDYKLKHGNDKSYTTYEKWLVKTTNKTSKRLTNLIKEAK